MSLINQMLRDLEERKRRDAGEVEPVHAVHGPTRRGHNAWLRPAAGGAFVVAVALTAFWVLRPTPRATVAHSTATATPAATVSVAHDANATMSASPVVPQPEAAAKPRADESRPPAPVVTVATVTGEAGRSGLRLNLDPAGPVDVEQADGDIRVVLPAGVDAEKVRARAADLGAVASALAGARTAGRPVINLTLAKGYRFSGSVPAGGPTSALQELTLWFAEVPEKSAEPTPPVAKAPAATRKPVAAEPSKAGSTHAAATSAAGEMSIQPRKPGPAELARRAYAAGATALRHGDYATAASDFRKALDEQPARVEYREALAAALEQLGRTAEVDRLLREGMKSDTDGVRLRKLYARILLNRGQLDEAITTLQGKEPTAEGDPEYHAFLAALLQRAGRNAEAAAEYRKVLAVRPTAGVWWAGLGISLEQLGKADEAYQAYRRARDEGNLSPSVERYVTGRIKALAPEGGDR
ncbi:MAG: tetratricopeptide repeat protein [Gammaproteobacteria bacterium]